MEAGLLDFTQRFGEFPERAFNPSATLENGRPPGSGTMRRFAHTVYTASGKPP
jgi:hypothetical protein